MDSIKNIHLLIFNKLFIFEAFVFFCLIPSSKNILIGNYPYIKQLNNKKYILISEKGITFLDPTLTYSSNEITFEDNTYSTFYYALSTIAVQFSKEDGNLIFAMERDTLYIFDQNENLLLSQSIVSNYYDSNKYYLKAYHIIPYKRVDNTFNAIYYNLNKFSPPNIFVNFQILSYDYDNNVIYFSESITHDFEVLTAETVRFDTKGSLGCCLLKKNGVDVINCIFGTWDYVQLINFYPENNFASDEPLIKNKTKTYLRTFFKSIALPGNEQAVHCSFSELSFECIEYDINSNTYTSFLDVNFNSIYYSYDFFCDLIYFEETGKLLFSLFGFDDNAIYTLNIFICDFAGNCNREEFNTIGDISLADAKSRINVVIPLDKLTYHLFVYKSDLTNYCLDLDLSFNLICRYYYNYRHTSCLEEIPEGYYCNSTEDKTLDLCHSNCKTCVEGPTEENNNCIKCKYEGNIYYDLGNCKSTCPNGYFTDEIHNLTCKCVNNIKCFYCDRNNLCTICNIDQGFYPKSDEEINTEYVNCYKDPDGYYLSDNKYYSCYSTCKKCTGQGTEDDHKCTECKDGYYFDENVVNHCKECKMEDFLKDICDLNIPNQDILNTLRTSIINRDFEDLCLEIINNGYVLTKEIGNLKLQLMPLDNQIINNKNPFSIINLGECENILKKIYGLENKSILLLKIDIKIPGYSAIDVEYELYNPLNYSKLNLEYCDKKKIDIYVPANINSKEIFKYDPKSDYYNDLCFPYTNQNESDVTMLDRKDEFVNKNLSLCFEDCEFKGYDSENQKAICNCNIKYYIREISKIDNIDSEKFFKGWVNIENIINIQVIKCIKLFFTKDGFVENIGNWILLSIIFLFIISEFYFYFKGFPKLISDIDTLKKDIINDLDNETKKINKVSDNVDDKIINGISEENIGKKITKIKKIKIKKKRTKNTLSKKNPNKINLISNNNLESKKYLTFLESSKKSIDIDINKNNSSEKLTLTKLSDSEINSLNYKDALELDKRTYMQYYWSLIKAKQLLIFTFYFNKDYNSYIIKIELFLFAIALYLTISALFFNDTSIHQIYEDEGIFNFVYNIPQIAYSTIISAVINLIVKTLSLTESKVLELKKEKDEELLNKKSLTLVKKLKLKFILFYIITSIFLIFFWIYLSCFCAVYVNTQYHLIKDSLVSFSLSLVYPFALNLIPIFIRIPAIKKRNKECMYKISKAFQMI